MNELVRDGYDRIAERYARQRDRFSSQPYLERLAALLPGGGRVLDLGCGAGVPAAAYLVERGFEVTGIDISKRMVALARENVPDAAFEVRDMLMLRPGEYAVDGVVALYSVFHVGRAEHAGLLGVLRSFLPDNGAILLTMGASEWEGREPDFHGVEMFWSHYGPERNHIMLEAAGFSIVADEIDASGGERHQMLLGRAIAFP